jgi:uncharacterized membrane protein YdfJ with MMPL/SSD domain
MSLRCHVSSVAGGDSTASPLMFVPATLLLVGKYNWWIPSLRRARRQLSTA